MQMYNLRGGFASKERWLWISILAAILFFSFTLRKGHNWGGDFAIYLKEAYNLAHGIPYQNTGVFPNPYNPYISGYCPPGFPLLLAPFVRLWGIDLQSLEYYKILVIIVFAIGVYFVYKVFSFFSDETAAFWTAFFTLFHFFVFVFKENILSDFSFFTGVYCFLWLHLRFPSWRFLPKYLVLLWVILIRTAGWTLLLALLLSEWKKIPFKKLLYATGLFAAIVIIYFAFAKPEGIEVYLRSVKTYPRTLQQFTVGPWYALEHLSWKEVLIFKAKELVSQFVYYGLMGFENASFLFRWLWRLIAIALTIWGVRQLRQHSIYVYFIGLYALLIWLWPVTDKRYFLPLLPFMLWTCLHWGFTYLKKMRWIIVAAFIAFYIGPYTAYFKNFTPYLPEGIHQQTFQDLITFLKRQPQKRIVFFKPETIALFTHHQATTFPWEAPQLKYHQWYIEKQIDYWIFYHRGTHFQCTPTIGSNYFLCLYLLWAKEQGWQWKEVYKNEHFSVYSLMKGKVK